MLTPKALIGILFLIMVLCIQTLTIYFFTQSHDPEWIIIQPLIPALTRIDEASALVVVPETVAKERLKAPHTAQLPPDASARLEILSGATLSQADRARLDNLLDHAEMLEKQGQTIRHDIESLALKIHAQLTPKQIEFLSTHQNQLNRLNSEHALLQKLRELFYHEPTPEKGEKL